jgi:hypothetical protein
MTNFSVGLPVVAFASILAGAGSAPKQSDIYEGRPAYKEADAGGYYVWHDGNKWHVRWIAVDRPRDFAGSVAADGGELRELRQVESSVEGRDVPWLRRNTVAVGNSISTMAMTGMPATDRSNIRNDGKARIAFNVRTENDIDGFDFSPGEGVTALRIVLQIDRKSAPDRVRIGSGSQQPDQLPLMVALK